MAYDIQNITVLDANHDIFETHFAGAVEHLVLLIAPVELTHGDRISGCVPFVNTVLFSLV
jgi:hypothetical protein